MKPSVPQRLKPLLMLVDDNVNNLNLIGAILHLDLDCDCIVAENGAAAIEKAITSHPDLILLDVMMPTMDGYEVCTQLKQNAATAEIPVIFLTALIGGDDIVRGFTAGAVDYVAKPFHNAELLARVKTQLKLKEDRDTIQRQNDEYRQLLHVLCHDLANPFAAIITSLELIDNPERFCLMKENLQEAAESGLKLIDLVRRYRSQEEKGITPAPVTTELLPLANQSKLLLQARFREKNISIKMDVLEDIKVKVEPVSFVNSVLNNLLSNAIKFSYPNSQIELKARHELAGKTLIGIRDHGIGMPAMLLDSLFDIHQTTSRPGTAGEIGTGFGMPLVKRFVEAAAGTIRITSRDQREFPDSHGTTVFIVVPAD